MSIIADEDLKKILNNFQFLFPDETSAEELDILFNNNIELKKVDEVKPVFHLFFYTSQANFKHIQANLMQIEANLQKKAEVIFKWFPACKITQVKIKPS